MTLELVPVVIGGVLALCGLAVAADGWLADPARDGAERRRHARAERHRGGEVALGVGLVLAAAALVGRDAWRYGTAAVLLAAVLVLAGAALNGRFLAERVANRGAARRGRLAERRRTGATAAGGESPRRLHDRRAADGADRRGTPGAPRGTGAGRGASRGAGRTE